MVREFLVNDVFVELSGFLFGEYDSVWFVLLYGLCWFVGVDD